MRKSLALCLLALALAAVPASAEVLFATGFEAPDYATGDLTGQQGWTPASTVNFTVTAVPDFVIAGEQSLLVTGNAGRSATRAIAGTGYMRYEITMAKAMQNAAQWWTCLQAGSSARTAAFGFESGLIRYYAGGTGWTTYGAFDGATAYNFKAEINTTTKTWDFWVNDALAASDIPFFHATAGAPTQIYMYRGYLSLTDLPNYANYTMADSIQVTAIPEPSSILALVCGLVGVGGYIRRRK